MKVVKVKITMYNYAIVSKDGQVQMMSTPVRMTTDDKEAYKALGQKVVSLSNTKNAYQMPVDQFIQQATLTTHDNDESLEGI